MLRSVLGPVALFLLAAQAGVHAQPSRLSPAEVEKLEGALKTNPGDPAARSALLEYYFLARISPAVALPARRRHILWVISNAPDSDLAYGPMITIDRAGHWLADPEGFRLASAAWRAQAAKPDSKPMTLANAAYFFKTEDKTYTLGLLKRALSLDPANKEIGARLGDEYALVILGLTMVNRSGYPVGNDRALTQSALARQCRGELAASRNPYVLSKAGYQLLWQGDILYYSHRLPFDPEPLAKTALDRAVSLEPRDEEIASLRAEYDKFQSLKHRAPALDRNSFRSLAPPDPPAPAPPASAAPPRPTPPEITAGALKDGLKRVAVGMSRDQLLELGSPAGRLTMEEDGHLIEVYQYSAEGAHLATVRLKDGAVASVEMR